MRGIRFGFTAFWRDKRGNILPLAAVGMLLSAALVGGGIDMSRAYRVQNALQSACDAGVLAGRRAVASSGYNQSAQDQATTYFGANFDRTLMDTTDPGFSSTSADNGKTVQGSASVDLNMAVMQIFGFKKFTLAVSCQASMGVGNSDVMMVLDTTGSMGSALGSGTRISALQDAMKNFYTTVQTASTGTNARIRYGFVPFSSSVNVGKLLYDKNPSYLINIWGIQSRKAVFAEWGTTTYAADNPQYGDWSSDNNGSCPSTGSWSDYGTLGKTYSGNTVTATQPQRRKVYECWTSGGSNKYHWRYEYRIATTTGTTNSVGTGAFDHWDYQQVSYDVSSYKAFTTVTTKTGTNGTDVSSTWAGCIEERTTVVAATFAYSTINGITPTGAYDLDLDTAPTSTTPDTQWRPMWPEVAYRRNASSPVSTACPAKAQSLQVMTQSDFNTYAGSLVAAGSTYLDVGMTWGGRLSSPQGIFADIVNDPPTNGGEVSRHLIFMSDGDMDPAQTSQSAWGIEELDRRVTDDGSDSQDKSRHLSRFQAICAAIKAKGIRIWTISFTTGSSSALTTCASANSAFNADDADELNAAFQEIAKQVGELRIVQ